MVKPLSNFLALKRKVIEVKSQPKAGKAASKLISEKIAALDDWRGETLARMRALIKAADPDIVEEWKWMGNPGMVPRWGYLHGRVLQVGREADVFSRALR